LEVDELPIKIITTSSVDAGQGSFEMVHLNVYEFPDIPVKLEVRLEGVVTVPPVPETMLQAPVPAPAAGAFAARAIDVAPQVDVRSVPAFDVVGLRLKIINTSLVDVHGLLDMVHRKV
jgi:hypothetical protein